MPKPNPDPNSNPKPHPDQAVRDADCYMFDEASSFLDIKQRMTATELIRSLAFDGAVQDGGVANKYALALR